MISVTIGVFVFIGICVFVYFRSPSFYRTINLATVCIIGAVSITFFMLICGSIFAQPYSYEDYPVYRYNDILYYQENNVIKELKIKNLGQFVDPKVKEVYLRKTIYENLYWLKNDTYDLAIPAEDVSELK